MRAFVTSDRPIRSRSILAVLVLAGAVAAIAGGSANAGSQAANGRIAYVSDAACRFDPTLKNEDIFSMAPDGSGKADLTRSANPDSSPAWSADGTKLAFTRPGKADNDDVFVMSSNGKAQRNVTKTSPDDANPDWTPDGSKITYDVSGTTVFSANSDGTGIAPLIPGGYEASWSPTGKIAYTGTVEPSNAEIFVANADGSGAQNGTRPATTTTRPCGPSTGRGLRSCASTAAPARSSS
jgi:Tol biopolymer transport system component